MKPGELDELAAKPIKYFSHDTNASDDDKCDLLIELGGWAAYGRWWRLCEVLGASDGHYLKIITDVDKRIAKRKLRFDSIDELTKFLDLLREVGLIAADFEYIYSNRMFKNAKKVAAHRIGAAKTNAKRWSEK